MPPARRFLAPSPLRCLRVVVAASLTLASGVAAAGELTVCAAASLTNAFREIGSAFEAANPGTEVRFNFAASGQLLRQIARGAPVDVFASADQETMNQAEQQKLLRPGTRADFVSNSLVVIVPVDKTPPRGLADLVGPAVRQVAIGVPASVPAGRYTRAALEKAGLWPQVEAKMIGAQSVRQVLDYVARGEVDAGFVYRSDAALMPGKVKMAFTVPTEQAVTYPIAVVAASSNGAAERFVAYVGSLSAQAVFARFGFAKP